MYTQQPKKMLIINILDILRKYTDVNHRLSQREIIDILQRDYEMTADRKAIKRNLMNLIDFGYEIQYTETVRKNKNGEEEILYSDWYLEREFSDAELAFMIEEDRLNIRNTERIDTDEQNSYVTTLIVFGILFGVTVVFLGVYLLFRRSLSKQHEAEAEENQSENDDLR